jgi:hypothetical protein
MQQIPDYMLEPPEPKYDCLCENEGECDSCQVEDCECLEHDTGCDTCRREKGCTCDWEYDNWKDRDLEYYDE